MTRKERVRLAAEHKEADIVPYYIRFMAPGPIAKHLNDDNFEESFGNHFGIFRPRFSEMSAAGIPSEFGVPFDATRTGQGTYINEDNLYSFPFPDVNDDKYWAGYDEMLVKMKDRYQFFDISGTMFERAYSLRGYQQTLEDMMLDKDFINKLFDRILEFDLAFLEKGLKRPVDGVRFGDDWGTQKNMLIPPDIWRELIKPRMKVLFETCRKAGKTTLLHSCGNIEEVIPDLIEIGLTILEPMQP